MRAVAWSAPAEARTTEPSRSAVAAPPASLAVDCTHCRSIRVDLHGRASVALIVTRYAALETQTLGSNDLAALPYGRIADALALVPFVLPSLDGTNISDRGLGSGRGLVIDDGVPVADLAKGSSGLTDFPDRYVRSVGLQRHDAAFRYGSYSGGGIFSLGRSAGEGSWSSADLGLASSFVAAPQIGGISPAYGESSDGGLFARRADVDTSGGFAGGQLRGGVGAGAQTSSDAGNEVDGNFNVAHLGYATASRRYRTFIDASAENLTAVVVDPSSPSYRSSYFDLGARVEHPGPVTLAFGATLRRETAVASLYGGDAANGTDAATEKNVYVEASAGSAATGMTAGLALADIVTSRDVYATEALQETSLVPSLSGRVALGGGAYARLGYSEALRLPTLLEYQTRAPGSGTAALERSELAESALGIDTGTRLKAEAIAFREFTRGFDEGRLEGLGASLVWQVAPLVSLRVWSLHDSPSAAQQYGGSDLSRQVLWTTYANGAGFRADAIAHRDTGSGAGIALDGDVYVPLQRFAALDVGTSRRGAARRYYVGLRSR